MDPSNPVKKYPGLVTGVCDPNRYDGDRGIPRACCLADSTNRFELLLQKLTWKVTKGDGVVSDLPMYTHTCAYEHPHAYRYTHTYTTHANTK